MNQKEVTIRRGVRKEDVAAVLRIVKTSGFFDELPEEVQSAEDDIREALELGEKKSGSTYLFAEEDGKTVGFVSFGQLPCARCHMIHWIAVQKELRGHGIGGILMREALAVLKREGAHKVFLQTSGREQYKPTRGFYSALGFALEATLKDYYLPGEDCLFFSKNIVTQ